MQLPVYEVSQINEYLKLRFDDDAFLSSLLIRGEVSNYKLYPSGHHYFSLKDANGAIRCVLFKGNAFRLRFRPENGMKVIAAGRISVYPRDGAYQLYCTELIQDGIGDLHVAFEQLKEKLQKEGLFDQSRKKPLPAFPHRIALVTSPAGAAVRDMLRILRARYPLTEVKFLPVRVQGEEAPEEIAAAIAYANRYALADLIITGRGGGSMEDLWAFNDERVARAIADSHIPVISAVGHEPDVTISDFVADLRAATPSNAAELAVPDQAELRQSIAAKRALLLTLVTKRLRIERQQLKLLRLKSPQDYIADRRMQTDFYWQRLVAACDRRRTSDRERFVHLAAKLDAMSPLKVLSRGYAITMKEDGSLVKRASELKPDERVTLRYSDATAYARIEEVP